MSLTPREIGTLIVVILRAAHLPNKRNIGKQDPYCVVSVNGEKRRTKAIRRGGQHPEWDEEIRFTLFEDVEDVLDRTAHTDGTPPPPPPKDDIRGPKRIKGGKSMALACYADDPREPDLIGETTVDLTEVLTKGETDEWFSLSNKDKFAGKVYLELTFWSNEPPPEKKASTKPKANKEYLGPGSFTPAEDTPLQSSRAASTSNLHDHSRQSSDSIPASLRASNTLARLDLYVPPYERTSVPPADQLANDFSEFGMSDSHRRQSFPPPQRGYTPRSVSAGYSAYSPHPYESDPVYAYDRPVTPTHQSFLHHSNSINSHPSYSSPATYQPQYETRSSTLYHHSPTRGIPTSSSGFMPLSNSSGFVPLASHPSEGYSQSLSHIPAPIYNQSQFQPTTPYTPISSQTPIPANPLPYIPSSSSASFHSQQSFQPSQSFTYPQYDYSTPTPTPQPYITPQPPASIPTHIQTPAPTPTYQNYSTPSPPHNPTPPIPVPQNPLSSSLGAGSRPLPQQPQVVYVQQQIQPPYPPPPPPPSSNSQQQMDSYSPPHAPLGTVPFPPSSSFQPPPPPPPLPSNIPPQTNGQHPGPPPPQYNPNVQPRRRSSLPQPPVTYPQQQSNFQQQPLESSIQVPPPPQVPSQGQPYHPGPPPRPPAQLDQSQWLPTQTQSFS